MKTSTDSMPVFKTHGLYLGLASADPLRVTETRKISTVWIVNLPGLRMEKI